MSKQHLDINLEGDLKTGGAFSENINDFQQTNFTQGAFWPEVPET